MHAEYLEVSRALLQWSHRQPAEIAIKAELLAFGLELLVDQPDYIPLRQLIRMNAADLVTFVRDADRPSELPPYVSADALLEKVRCATGD